MVLEVGEFAEASAAHVTLMWPAAVVHIHVTLEVAGRGERLGAQTTLMGLLLKERGFSKLYRTSKRKVLLQLQGFRSGTFMC